VLRSAAVAKLGHAQLVAAAARTRTRRLHHAAGGLDVEDGLAHFHAGLPVDARVVHLGVERHLAALQAVDDEELPHRPAAVDERGMQPRHVLLQLPVGARLGQRDVAHVVVDVDVVVVHPHGVGHVEGHQRELAREHVGQVDAAGHEALGVFVEVALVALGQVEHVERAHVHRHFRRFHVQEGGIKTAQVFHVSCLLGGACAVRQDSAGVAFVGPRFFSVSTGGKALAGHGFARSSTKVAAACGVLQQLLTAFVKALLSHRLRTLRP
jgi:hypothetical protein